MRKVVFGGANTLDNFIARRDGAVDWILWNDEVTAIIAESWWRFDTIVMGRKTYEPALAHSGGNNPYKGVKTYVFSHTLGESQDRNVEIIRADAAEFVRKLKTEEGKDICVMGGGLLAKSLFEADLIDEVGCNIHPVLLGQGVPLFHEISRQIDLELIACKVLKTGCVYVSYSVKHKATGN